MLFIVMDGFDIFFVWIDYFFINFGEIYDVIVIVNNIFGNFWICVEFDEVLDVKKVIYIIILNNFIFSKL